MLRELPLDFVKIDQTVITSAIEDTPAQAVLLAIIAYARSAGAYVIAEGIESEQILAFVRNTDDLHDFHDPSIKGGQGYLLGRPSSDISELIGLSESKTHELVSRPPFQVDRGPQPASATARVKAPR
jgi:EAL domain-containing protein (putative c-di-GMP-specific phosphodiesterase class I)